MLLSTCFEVGVVVDRVGHQRSTVNAGWIWLHLVIPGFCVSARVALDALQLWRHRGELVAGVFVSLRDLFPEISGVWTQGELSLWRRLGFW